MTDGRNISSIFVQVLILWFKNREVDYFEFCKLWSSSAFKLVLVKKRLCCGKDLMHRYDVDGHIRKARCMVRDGVVLSELYDVMQLSHNYRKLRMVLHQVKSRFMLNIIKDEILQN
jgi:hypothetical protein